MSEETNSSNQNQPAPLGEIEHGPSKLEQFLEKNFKMILLLALVIVIASAAFIITGKLGRAKDTSAGSALVAAKDASAYKKVSQEHEGTPAALSAQLLLAEQLWKDDSKDEAIATLKALSENEATHPAVQQARFALATSYLSEEKTDEAKSLLNSIVSDENAKHLHPASLILLGDIEKAAGNDEAAEAFYQRKLDSFPTYADGNLTNTRLNLIGVDSPERIEPPAPPAPPAAPEIKPELPEVVTPRVQVPASEPVSVENAASEVAPENTEETSESAEETSVEEEATEAEKNQENLDEN